MVRLYVLIPAQTTTAFNHFLELNTVSDPNAVRVLDRLHLRYFSPTELLRLFCFEPPSASMHATIGVSIAEESFNWPATTSNKTKYRLLGNSVNVTVVSVLIDYMME